VCVCLCGGGVCGWFAGVVVVIYEKKEINSVAESASQRWGGGGLLTVSVKCGETRKRGEGMELYKCTSATHEKTSRLPKVGRTMTGPA
jgi:hypothetical protein